MFDIAVKAGLPLISVTTSDTITAQEVMEYVLGTKVVLLDKPYNGKPLPGGTVFLAPPSVADSLLSRENYNKLLDSESTVVLLNPETTSDLVFNAGELPVPQGMLLNYIVQALPESDAQLILPSVSGLTIKESMEVIRLAMAQFGDVTPRSVAAIRSRLTGGTQGLVRVDTTLKVYMLNKELAKWVALNKKFFPKALDPRLVPRGVLLTGPAGVGKTQGAKFIANELGVPLYHLDIAASLNKYIGQSEANLSRMLRTLDREAPCVVLLDEVEKLFTGDEDSGVTRRMLSQLLWWLQEHTAPIITVMTTNDFSLLPAELYRAGRIDRVISVPPLEFKQDVQTLAREVLNSLNVPEQVRDDVWREVVKPMNVPIPHAVVVQKVYDGVKSLV